MLKHYKAGFHFLSAKSPRHTPMKSQKNPVELRSRMESRDLELRSCMKSRDGGGGRTPIANFKDRRAIHYGG